MGTSLERTSPRRSNGVKDTTVTYYGRSDVHDAFKQDGGLQTTYYPSCDVPEGFDIKYCVQDSNAVEEMCVFTCKPGYTMMNNLTRGIESSSITTFTCKSGKIENNFSCVARAVPAALPATNDVHRCPIPDGVKLSNGYLMIPDDKEYEFYGSQTKNFRGSNKSLRMIFERVFNQW